MLKRLLFRELADSILAKYVFPRLYGFFFNLTFVSLPSRSFKYLCRSQRSHKFALGLVFGLVFGLRFKFWVRFESVLRLEYVKFKIRGLS